MLAARRMMNRRGCVTRYSDCDTVTDAFNRADYGDGTLGFADTGQRWFNVGTGWSPGGWTTQGTTVNTAQGIAPDLTAYRFLATLLDAGGNNQDVSVDGEAADDDSVGIFLRCTADLQNGYHFFPNAYGDSSFIKYEGGVGTTLLHVGPLISPNTPFTARAVIKDNLFKGYVNGTLVGTVTIDPNDADGFCETDWTYLGFREDHGGPSGGPPTQLTVYTNTHWDNLNCVAPMLTESSLGLVRHWAAGTNSMTSGSYAPPPNTLIVVGVGILTNNAGSTGVLSISDTIGGLSWTKVEATPFQQFAGGSGVWYQGAFFYAFTGATPPTGAITITSTQNVGFNGEAHVWEVTNADPTTPVGATGEAATANGSSPFSLGPLTLSSTPDPSSLVLAMLTFQNTNPGVTDDPDYIHLAFDPETISGGMSMDWSACLHDADDTITWTSIPGNGGAQGLAIEIIRA